MFTSFLLEISEDLSVKRILFRERLPFSLLVLGKFKRIN